MLVFLVLRRSCTVLLSLECVSRFVWMISSVFVQI